MDMLRGLPEPYSSLFIHLQKTTTIKFWPSAPYSIPLNNQQLPINPTLRVATTTAIKPFSSILTTGTCSPTLQN